MLTVYGIETQRNLDYLHSQHKVAIVLTVYGIETVLDGALFSRIHTVAIVLTVYGIETLIPICSTSLFNKLQ